jgi:cell division protein FtsN
VRKKNKKVSLAKNPFLVLSRRAIAGWLAVFFIVCGWMFAIGILVGRGTAPIKFVLNEPQRKLAISLENLKKQEQGNPSEGAVSIKEKNELDFFEDLPDNIDDTKIPEKVLTPTPQKKEDPPPEAKSSKPKKESLKKKTLAEKKDKAKTETSDNESANSSETSKADKEGAAKTDDKPYAIQVAAFKDAADADKKVAELKKKGFSAYRVIGKVPGKGIWYRVRIGDYNDRDKAGDMMSRLKKAGEKPILVEQ